FSIKLGLAEFNLTQMILQLADCSSKRPMGIIEDVLVKVKNFIYPVDFMALDMEEERDAPLILGRPFLAIARALIVVEGGQLVLRVGDEKMILKIAASPEKLIVNP